MKFRATPFQNLAMSAHHDGYFMLFHEANMGPSNHHWSLPRVEIVDSSASISYTESWVIAPVISQVVYPITSRAFLRGSGLGGRIVSDGGWGNQSGRLSNQLLG
jgi:hypothetical protein